jgi:chromosome condensin MukBEF ATPase and DNA-binding subunit MukB
MTGLVPVMTIEGSRTTTTWMPATQGSLAAGMTMGGGVAIFETVLMTIVSWRKRSSSFENIVDFDAVTRFCDT